MPVIHGYNTDNYPRRTCEELEKLRAHELGKVPDPTGSVALREEVTRAILKERGIKIDTSTPLGMAIGTARIMEDKGLRVAAYERFRAAFELQHGESVAAANIRAQETHEQRGQINHDFSAQFPDPVAWSKEVLRHIAQHPTDQASKAVRAALRKRFNPRS